MKKFEFFSSRLIFVNITKDHMINFELWHYMNIFESYVYGIYSQYSRIQKNLKIHTPKLLSYSLTQVNLDIYYYILSWDKLKKVHIKFKSLINKVQRADATIPENFKKDIKLWKSRIDHLLAAFPNEARDEYEHPSLEAHRQGNIFMWQNIQEMRNGDIRAHVGKTFYIEIRKEHVEKLRLLYINLIDIILKHFTQKRLTTELLQLRDQFEDNIDTLIKECERYKKESNIKSLHELLSKIVVFEINLSNEGISIAPDILEKIHSYFYK